MDATMHARVGELVRNMHPNELLTYEVQIKGDNENHLIILSKGPLNSV